MFGDLIVAMCFATLVAFLDFLLREFMISGLGGAPMNRFLLFLVSSQWSGSSMGCAIGFLGNEGIVKLWRVVTRGPFGDFLWRRANVCL